MATVYTEFSINGLELKLQDLFDAYKGDVLEIDKERNMVKVHTNCSNSGLEVEANDIYSAYKRNPDSVYFDVDFSDFNVFSIFYGNHMEIGAGFSKEKLNSAIGGRIPVNVVYDVDQSIHHVCYDYKGAALVGRTGRRVVLSMENPERLLNLKVIKRMARRDK